MSTQVGSLQHRPRFSHLVGPAVAIALIAAAAIGTFSVLNDDTRSRSSSTSRSVNAESERWTAVAGQYLDGTRAVTTDTARWTAVAGQYLDGTRAFTTDAARWTAAAEAYGALESSAVLGVTTPSELGGAIANETSPALGVTTPSELRGIGMAVGDEPQGFRRRP